MDFEWIGIMHNHSTIADPFTDAEHLKTIADLRRLIVDAPDDMKSFFHGIEFKGRLLTLSGAVTTKKCWEHNGRHHEATGLIFQILEMDNEEPLPRIETVGELRRVIEGAPDDLGVYIYGVALETIYDLTAEIKYQECLLESGEVETLFGLVFQMD